MEIEKNITLINRTVMNNRKIKYIVIHYVGAVSTAKNNTIYFKNIYRGASAHYFVDDNSIWQCVEDKDTSWHCGAKKYYHDECRNSNSIGIEMCCYKKNGKLDISQKTIERTIELVKFLMEKYGIPLENVVRHYDVTHKVCPAPFVTDNLRWSNFKIKLGQRHSVINGFTSYLVKVTANALNVREGAGTNFKIKRIITNKGTYTIVAEENGWGKLKSGAGWICLNYTKRV